MKIVDVIKSNFVMIPVVASVIFGSFTGIKYVINLNDTIYANKQEIINLRRDIAVMSILTMVIESVEQAK